MLRNFSNKIMLQCFDWNVVFCVTYRGYCSPELRRTCSPLWWSPDPPAACTSSSPACSGPDSLSLLRTGVLGMAVSLLTLPVHYKTLFVCKLSAPRSASNCARPTTHTLYTVSWSPQQCATAHLICAQCPSRCQRVGNGNTCYFHSNCIYDSKICENAEERSLVIL